MLKDAEVVVTAWETGELTDLLDYTPRLQMVIHSGACLLYTSDAADE